MPIAQILVFWVLLTDTLLNCMTKVALNTLYCDKEEQDSEGAGILQN